MSAPGPEPRTIGWRAVRRDWTHFVRVRGESGPFAYLAVLFENPSLWALWIYRYGYWAYSLRSGLPAKPHRLIYQALYFIGQVLFKIAIDPMADIHDDVWLGPTGNILIGHHARVGTGSFLHGWNTLGLAAGVDVLPRLGERVHLGPGSNIIGPVEVPSDTVIGPNSVIVKNVSAPGAWLGSPVQPFDGPPQSLVPTARTARTARAARGVRGAE